MTLDVLSADSVTIGANASVDVFVDFANSDDVIFNGSSASTVTSIEVHGSDLSNTIDLSGVTASAFSAVVQVSIEGGSGNDTINGSALGDSIRPGDGNNFVDGKDGNDTITAGTGADSIVAGLGNDSVFAGDGNDSLVGGDGDDSLDGQDGKDTLTDGSGTDLLTGGSGGDTYIVIDAVGSATVSDHSGIDLLDFSRLAEGSTVIVDLGAGTVTKKVGTGANEVATQILTGVGSIEYVTGSAGNDTLMGTSSANSLLGGLGDDCISGAGGSDTIFGDSGDDVIDAGDSDDLVVGGLGVDVLTGGTGRDVVVGGYGGDTLNGDTVTSGSSPADTDGDLLIGGDLGFPTTKYKSGLIAILAFWKSTSTSYVDRQSGLETGSGTGLPSDVWLKTQPTDTATVFDDFEQNQFTGGVNFKQNNAPAPGSNWFFVTDEVSSAGTADSRLSAEDRLPAGIENAYRYFATNSNITSGSQPDLPVTHTSTNFPLRQLFANDPGATHMLASTPDGNASIPVILGGVTRPRYVVDSAYSMDGKYVQLTNFAHGPNSDEYAPNAAAAKYRVVINTEDLTTFKPTLPDANLWRWSLNPSEPTWQYGFVVDAGTGSVTVKKYDVTQTNNSTGDGITIPGIKLVVTSIGHSGLYYDRTTGQHFAALLGTTTQTSDEHERFIFVVNLDATQNQVVAQFKLTGSGTGYPGGNPTANDIDEDGFALSPDGRYVLVTYKKSVTWTQNAVPVSDTIPLYRLLNMDFSQPASQAITPHPIPANVRLGDGSLLQASTAFNSTNFTTAQFDAGFFPFRWSHPVFAQGASGDVFLVGTSEEWANGGGTAVNGVLFPHETNPSGRKMGRVLAFKIASSGGDYISLTDQTDGPEAPFYFANATNLLNPGYVFVAFGGKFQNVTAPEYEDKLLAIKLDQYGQPASSSDLVDLGTHQSKLGLYNTAPFINAPPDGSRLTFSTTWGDYQQVVRPLEISFTRQVSLDTAGQTVTATVGSVQSNGNVLVTFSSPVTLTGTATSVDSITLTTLQKLIIEGSENTDSVTLDFRTTSSAALPAGGGIEFKGNGGTDTLKVIGTTTDRWDWEMNTGASGIAHRRASATNTTNSGLLQFSSIESISVSGTHVLSSVRTSSGSYVSWAGDLAGDAQQNTNDNLTFDLPMRGSNVTIHAGVGHDTVIVGPRYSGTAAFDGGTGNDTLIGEAGDDLFIGGTDDDSLVGNGGNDTLDGNAGNDLLTGGIGGNGADSILTGPGADSITGGGGNDTLNGGAGSDTLDGGAGNDVYIFADTSTDGLLDSSGNDSLDFSALSNHLTVNLATGTAQITGSTTLVTGDVTSIENVIGGIGADSLTGSSVDNTFEGDGGADTLTGGAGIDSLAGGSGTDTLVESLSTRSSILSDTILSGNGIDTLSQIEHASLTAPTGNASINASGFMLGAVTLFGSSGSDTLTGTGFDDVLLGGSGIDRLVGGNGNDSLKGQGGSDTLDGGAGKDVYIFADTSKDSVLDSSGNDTLNFSLLSNNLTVNLATGTAQITGSTTLATGQVTSTENVVGGTGADRITGSSAGNTLQGGANDDTISGSGGNDSILGGSGNDSIDGGTGSDTINGGSGNDLIVGGDGNDRIAGHTGTDAIFGDAGDDVIVGGDGNDTLRGGNDKDVLIGDGVNVGPDTHKSSDSGVDNLDGNDGADTVAGGRDSDTLNGETIDEAVDLDVYFSTEDFSWIDNV